MLVTRARGRVLGEGVAVAAVVVTVLEETLDVSPTSGMDPNLLLEGEVNRLIVLEDRTDVLIDAVGLLVPTSF
jgi:hypothetical protein